MDAFVDYAQYAHYITYDETPHYVITGYSVKIWTVLFALATIALFTWTIRWVILNVKEYGFNGFIVLITFFLVVLSLALGSLAVGFTQDYRLINDSYRIESLSSLVEKEYGFRNINDLNHEDVFKIDQVLFGGKKPRSASYPDYRFQFQYLTEDNAIRTATAVWNNDAFENGHHPKIAILDENNNPIMPKKHLDYSACETLIGNNKYVDKAPAVDKNYAVQVCSPIK